MITAQEDIFFKIVKPRCEKTLRLNSFPVRCINKWNTLSEDIGAPRGLGDLGRMAIHFQGAWEHW